MDLQVFGSTTARIIKQGNIREDMFRLIAVADLVIADISIHNANVFYELGMRHALKPRHTFMIRCKSEQQHPFDLQTDRYFSYEASNPGASVAALAEALRASLNSPQADSPVFTLLPQLKPHGRGKLVSAPRAFQEDLERARIGKHYGTLRLFAQEAAAYEWDQEALRMIGNAQFKLRAYAGARTTFELLRGTDGEHVEANLRLGTIYQRLAATEAPARKLELMAESASAIQRVIDGSHANAELVEAHCLLGSNEKSRWIDELAGRAPLEQQAATLRSVHFMRMRSHYLAATNLDLNAHYSAMNALAILKIQQACAVSLPDAWQQSHDTDAGATAALAAIDTLAARLVATLHLALQLDTVLGLRPGMPDAWAPSSRADLQLLTAPGRTERVAQYYRQAVTGDDWFALDATRRNLEIYKNMGLFEPGVSAALEEIESAMAIGGQPPPRPAKVLLFTGHMIDAADKPEHLWRFPRTAPAQARARELIRSAVADEVAGVNGQVLGFAGGACGGDILFHEVCAELGVPTRLLLALPPERFQVTSVQHGGANWVERFHALLERLPFDVLQASVVPPTWLAGKQENYIWTRANHWMMYSAMSTGAATRSVLALLNRAHAPQGPGGAAEFFDEARDNGFKPVELDGPALLNRSTDPAGSVL
ncbi:tetratricopeptide repeat-containing protein [Massilia sp. S19_KUP03_FR1]|uniref:tetratricopeptide repeat-containing protein n=1 Tax=Massilia sp. S19_KUP03_FR1 TaxID=3025503 RepID=UPI002FCDC6FD